MRFSVKWASVGGAYMGMAFGVVMLAKSAGLGVFTILGGMFMGGAIGLPLTVAQFAAALIVKGIMMKNSLVMQMLMFILASGAFYAAIISMLDQWLSQMGGILTEQDAILHQIIFFAAGTGCSLLCMVLWGNRAGRTGNYLATNAS